MAEHPAEVADISASAAALTVSLGNITDARAESMLLAGKAIKRMKDAENAKRASVIDLVGITCSPFRMELAKRFIKECKPAVIKGNLFYDAFQWRNASLVSCYNKVFGVKRQLFGDDSSVCNECVQYVLDS